MKSHLITINQLDKFIAEICFASDSEADKRLTVITNLSEFSIYFKVIVRGKMVVSTSSMKDALDTYNSF